MPQQRPPPRRRLYLPPPLCAGLHLLSPERTHYLKNVLRIRSGTQLRVFDGTGASAIATATVEKRSCNLQIAAPLQHEPAPSPRVHLAVGLLKGKAMDQVLRKSTELGAADIWPIYTEHTHVPKRALQQSGDEHWQSILISAAEQCGQNHLPCLHPPQTFTDLLAQLPCSQVLVTDASGEPWPSVLPETDTLLLIGPEGGWSAAELDEARGAGHGVVNMGPLTLRAETAPLLALATLAASWRLQRRL